MTVGLDPKGSRVYVTDADRNLPSDQQTHWKIRDLSERERVAYMDGISLREDGAGGAQLGGQGTRTYLAVKNGLVGVEASNPLRDSKGDEIPFDTGKDGRVSDEFLERLPTAIKTEIGDAIVATMHLSVDDVEK